MPYNTAGEYYHTRRPYEDYHDPYKQSAEQLVRNVEEFLYDTKSENYMNPFFIAWSIRQFDLTKQGSGRPHDTLDFETGSGSFDYDAPPIPYPGKDGAEYKVEQKDGSFVTVASPTKKDQHWPRLP